MDISIARIYGKQDLDHNARILIDRVWPRGISKEQAHLDHWEKQIAPSKELRQWFNHDPQKFAEFKAKYLQELAANPQTPAFLKLIRETLKDQPVLLLYGAKDETHNQAVVLQEYLTNHL